MEGTIFDGLLSRVRGDQDREAVGRCILSRDTDLPVFIHINRQCGQLNVTNVLDLYSLHFVYLPRMNDHFITFINAWNAHPLSSEHNISTNQLWIRGLHELAGTSSIICKEIWEPSSDVR